MKKNKSSQYLIPYIDFAFMLIIILIALLSIAYFTPPGEDGTEKREETIDREESNKKLLIPLIAEKKESGEKASEEIKRKEKEIGELKKELQKKDEDIKLLQEKIKTLSTLTYPGKHEFTDLGK